MTSGTSNNRCLEAFIRLGWLLAALLAAVVVYGATRVAVNSTPAPIIALSIASLLPACLYLALLPGLVLLSAVSRTHALGAASELGLLLTGMSAAGMCSFWAWFENPVLGATVGLGIMAASAVVLTLQGFSLTMSRTALPVPLALVVAIGWLYTGIAFVQGGLAGDPAQTIAIRFWLAPDSQLPLSVAKLVAAHHSLSGYVVVGWQASDRPPLQSGIALMQFPLFGNRDLGYQALGTGIELLWIPALWVLLLVLGVNRRRIVLAVLATAVTGAIFINSVYVWPKMLSGALILSAVAILVSRVKADQWAGCLVTAAAVATLGLLGHGSAAYTLIGIAPTAILLAVRRRAWAEGALATAVAVILYLPWLAFQRLVAPPGDRLLYWQLAGVLGYTRKPLLQVIAARYGAVGLVGAIANKLRNLATIVARPDLWRVNTAEPAWTHSVLGLARIAQTTDFVCAACPLILGFLIVLSSKRRKGLSAIRPLLPFILVSSAVWVLLQFGSDPSTTLIQQAPYALLILGIGVSALSVTYLPRRLAESVLILGVAWFVLEWVPGISFIPALGSPVGPVSVDKGMALIGILGAGSAMAILVHVLSPEALPGWWNRILRHSRAWFGLPPTGAGAG